MKKILCGLMICIMTIFTLLSNVSASTKADENWNKIVTAMKNEKIISYIETYWEEDVKVTVTSTDNQINYVIKNNTTGLDYNIKVERSNMIAYITTSQDRMNVDFELRLYETYLAACLLTATVEVHDYDNDAFYDWLYEQDVNEMDVVEDGFEINSFKILETEVGEDGKETENEVNVFESVWVNIEHGFQSFINYINNSGGAGTVDPEPEAKPEESGPTTPDDSKEEPEDTKDEETEEESKDEVKPENPTQPSEPSNPTEPEVDPEPETKPEESEPTPDEPKDEEVKDEEVKDEDVKEEETKEEVKDEEVKPEVTPEEDKETTVENPPTSLYTSFGIIGVAIISLIIFMVSRKKTYFSKI